MTTYHRSKKVLIIDDDPSVRETLSHFLFSQGLSVGSAESGSVALDILSQSTFDLLIVDAYMPEMNGVQLLKCLKERKITIPSVFISGVINEEMRNEAHNLEVVAVMEKPFSINEIFYNIQQGLAQLGNWIKNNSITSWNIPTVNKGSENMKEITLCSKKSCFPIRVKFIDKNDTTTDYVLFKTSKEKLILQKPLFNDLSEKKQRK